MNTINKNVQNVLIDTWVFWTSCGAVFATGSLWHHFHFCQLQFLFQQQCMKKYIYTICSLAVTSPCVFKVGFVAGTRRKETVLSVTADSDCAAALQSSVVVGTNCDTTTVSMCSGLHLFPRLYWGQMFAQGSQWWKLFFFLSSSKWQNFCDWHLKRLKKFWWWIYLTIYYIYIYIYFLVLAGWYESSLVCFLYFVIFDFFDYTKNCYWKWSKLKCHTRLGQKEKKTSNLKPKIEWNPVKIACLI